MWNTIIYQPLYNAFVYLLNIVPNNSIALAIILFTIFVKIILFPLHKKNITNQHIARKIQPLLKELQEKYKDDKQALTQKTLELYKEHGTNPFSSLFLIFIQIPILFALYFIFRHGVQPDAKHLYSFVTFPTTVDGLMFGFIDASKRFIPLSILVGITQALQARSALPKEEPAQQPNTQPTLADEIAKSMRIQVLYFLPVFVAVVSLGFPSAIALYWVISNLFGIAQELYIKKTLKTA